MRVILLGAPGVGKGTQAKIFTEKFGLCHISTGDLFRAEIAAKSALGLKVADYLKNGTLVPDSVVIEMVGAKLDKCSQGWVLDGYPRTLEQAQALDQYLKRSGTGIDHVVYINLPQAEILRRLTSRRSCSNCGALYNLASRPPQVEGKCDKCGNDLVQREDDKETTVKKRLMVYEDLTQPLIAYYRAEQRFHEVDGSKTVEQVTEQLNGIFSNTAGAGTR